MGPKKIKEGTEGGEKKKRSPNWSTKDSCLLVEIYERYHEIIVGQFQGRVLTKKKKDEAWKKMEDEFNGSPIDFKRSLEEIKSRIENMKKLARELATAMRKYETGGGPKPKDPESFIQKMYDIIFGTSGDSLVGIGSGMESGAGTARKSVDSEDDDEDESSFAARNLADGNSNETDDSQLPNDEDYQPQFDSQTESIVQSQPRIVSQKQGEPPQLSVAPKYQPRLPLKKRKEFMIPTSNKKAPPLAAEAALVQHALMEEQLRMVQDQRKLIAEQIKLTVEKRKYIQMKSALYQHQIDGATVVTSTGTPSSNLVGVTDMNTSTDNIMAAADYSIMNIGQY